MSMEAAAGKNPFTHVGKLYAFAAQQIAQSVVVEAPDVKAAECFLASQIGQPIQQPQLSEVRIQTQRGDSAHELDEQFKLIVDRELSQIDALWKQIVAGSVCVV